MKTLHLTGLALAIAAGFALPLAGSAEAAMGGALPSTQILPIEKAQFFFLGHNFCWYDDGWQGPGWYWCDYAWNTGYGWGGGDGWRGWNRSAYHGPRSAPRHGAVNRTPGISAVHAPMVNAVRAPRVNAVRAPMVNAVHAPRVNAVRTTQFRGGAVGHGAGPSRPGTGAKGDTKPGNK